MDVNGSQSRDSVVDYPPELDTDFKQLAAVYSLLERMREKHNETGLVAIADWDEHQGRWQTYTDLFVVNQIPLLIEQQQLRLNVRREIHSDAAWALFDSDQKAALFETVFGNKDVLRKLSTTAKSRHLDELFDIDFLSLEGLDKDPLEDWLTYTEDDPNGVITVASNLITITNMARGDDPFVHDDKGVAHFGLTGIDHDFSIDASAVGVESEMIFWALANITAPDHNTDPIIFVWVNSAGRVRLHILDGATNENDFTGAGTDLAIDGTEYWFTITRDGGGSVVRIYDDAGRTVLRDTLTVAQGTTLFDIIHSILTRSGLNVNLTSGHVRDLDLNEPEPPSPAVVSFPEYGQVRTAIGDPAVFGATILRS